MTELTPAERAWVDAQVAKAPPLTQEQVDTIARVFGKKRNAA